LLLIHGTDYPVWDSLMQAEANGRGGRHARADQSGPDALPVFDETGSTSCRTLAGSRRESQCAYLGRALKIRYLRHRSELGGLAGILSRWMAS